MAYVQDGSYCDGKKQGFVVSWGFTSTKMYSDHSLNTLKAGMRAFWCAEKSTDHSVQLKRIGQELQESLAVFG